MNSASRPPSSTVGRKSSSRTPTPSSRMAASPKPLTTPRTRKSKSSKPSCTKKRGHGRAHGSSHREKKKGSSPESVGKPREIQPLVPEPLLCSGRSWTGGGGRLWDDAKKSKASWPALGGPGGGEG